MSRIKQALGLAMMVGYGASAWAWPKDVKSVTAEVMVEWNDSEKLKGLHEELQKKYKGAPSLEALKTEDRWFALLDMGDIRRPKSLAARSQGVAGVKRGDIVEIAYAVPSEVKEYAELPRIVKVVCSSGEPNFAECKAKARLGPLGANGQPVSWW